MIRFSRMAVWLLSQGVRGAHHGTLHSHREHSPLPKAWEQNEEKRNIIQKLLAEEEAKDVQQALKDGTREQNICKG